MNHGQPAILGEMVLQSQKKKFLVVRFAPGSGGKFLSTLFQCCNLVHAWDKELVLAKQQNDHEKIFSYITSKFTTDFKNWQKIEPEVPYQTEFVSNRFPRGDSVSFEQAQQLLISDVKYQNDYKNDGQIVLILNKSQVPQWLWEQANIVNILIDNKQSKKWYRSAKLQKLFVKLDDSSYVIKQDHEDYCSSKRAKLATQFNNEKIFQGSWHSFVKKYIINDELEKTFTSKELITAHPTNINTENFFFNLSLYADETKFVEQFQNLCKQFDIAPLPSSLILKIIKHYQSLHYPDLNKTIFSGNSYVYQKKMQFSQWQVSNAVDHPDYLGFLGDQIPSFKLNKFLASSEKTVLVTDNKITVPLNINQTILDISPEFYGIHHMPFDLELLPAPNRAYNCLINRICPNRQSWFYKLFDIGLDKGFVSFNIDYRDLPSQSYADKLDLFDQLHYKYNTIFQRQFNETRPLVPYCNFKQTSNIENIISESVISIVIETYFDDNRAIALSEKIFRALQLPRPFLLFAPKGTIRYLESVGFKIINDIINHDYDNEESWITRQTMILEQLEKFVNNPDYTIPQRWIDIAYHNQKILHNWNLNWDIKIQPAIDMATDILYN
jgi:hypothetical protein